MDKKLLFKMLAIGLMALLLLILLLMVEGQISDRAQRQREVQDIANSSAGESLAAGVDLVLVSYDPRQVYRALAGAADALAEHRITPARLAESDRRLADFVSLPAPLVPTAIMQERLSSLAPVAGHQTICCGQQEKTAKNQICPAPSTPAQFGGMPARL